MISFEEVQKKYQTEPPTEEIYVLLQTIARLTKQLADSRKAHMKLVDDYNKKHYSPYDDTVFQANEFYG